MQKIQFETSSRCRNLAFGSMTDADHSVKVWLRAAESNFGPPNGEGAEIAPTVTYNVRNGKRKSRQEARKRIRGQRGYPHQVQTSKDEILPIFMRVGTLGSAYTLQLPHVMPRFWEIVHTKSKLQMTTTIIKIPP